MRSGTAFFLYPWELALLGFGWGGGGGDFLVSFVCSQDVLQIPNVFLTMFPIASHL
jgi:hypothetical protein